MGKRKIHLTTYTNDIPDTISFINFITIERDFMKNMINKTIKGEADHTYKSETTTTKTQSQNNTKQTSPPKSLKDYLKNKSKEM